MVSTCPLISKSSSHFNNPLVTVPRAPNTTGIIVTFMFHSYFHFPSKVQVLLFTFFQFYFVVSRTAKSTILQVLFCLLIIIRSGRLAEIMWSFYLSKSYGSLCVLFSRTDAVLCICHLFVWSNFNFLHNTQWIPLPTQSCLVLYFCANFLHSLIMGLIVSSLSPHNKHLLFCSVLSILALIWCCFVLLFGEIQLLSLGFLFFATSTFFRARCCLLVV